METFALLVGLIVVLAYLVIQSGLLPLGSREPTIPKVQTLANAGTVWEINASAPRVLDFATSGPAEIWMNATLQNAITIFLCPSNITIKPMGFPPCDAAGGIENLINWSFPAPVAGGWQLAFFNYGPQQGYLPVVTVMWLTPLEVVET